MHVMSIESTNITHTLNPTMRNLHSYTIDTLESVQDKLPIYWY